MNAQYILPYPMKSISYHTNLHMFKCNETQNNWLMNWTFTFFQFQLFTWMVNILLVHVCYWNLIYVFFMHEAREKKMLCWLRKYQYWKSLYVLVWRKSNSDQFHDIKLLFINVSASYQNWMLFTQKNGNKNIYKINK